MLPPAALYLHDRGPVHNNDSQIVTLWQASFALATECIEKHFTVYISLVEAAGSVLRMYGLGVFSQNRSRAFSEASRTCRQLSAASW